MLQNYDLLYCCSAALPRLSSHFALPSVRKSPETPDSTQKVELGLGFT